MSHNLENSNDIPSSDDIIYDALSYAEEYLNKAKSFLSPIEKFVINTTYFDLWQKEISNIDSMVKNISKLRSERLVEITKQNEEYRQIFEKEERAIRDEWEKLRFSDTNPTN